MRSYDVFDTLIARRHYDPQSIFRLIEQRHNIPNFCQKRLKAEQVEQRKPNYTIYDIYKHLDVDPEIEIQMELEQSIPIRENLNKVQDGDVLISDMYLTPEIILKLLQKHGFDKDVEIHVSSNGKATGRAWKKYKTEFHTGDNPHSDAPPDRPYVISKATHFTEWETKLPYDLKIWVRQTRLAGEGVDWFYQSQYNLPFLYSCCSYFQHPKVLFCSRDCKLLKYFYKYYYPETECVYFYTNRRISNEPPENYMDYVREIAKDALIVDIAGTNVSHFNLFNKLNMELNKCILVYYQHLPHRPCQYPPIRLSTYTDSVEYYQRSEVGNQVILEALKDMPELKRNDDLFLNSLNKINENCQYYRERINV